MVSAVTAAQQAAAGTPAAGTAGASASSAASLNYNSFLKLFMAELQNQDPTSPMDTTQQMSQLASFSQVEQQVKMNTNLSTLISQSMIGQAGNLIGKTVTDADGNSGVVQSINVAQDSSTSAVTLTATLTSGTKMTIGGGVTIAATPPATTQSN
ncbi:flagellar hook assembly protein FlgD [Rhizobium sp. C1]|uniref:flagellar hook assembly protein FlgD n=1 Tax=Rhizobium sp. C1 TaxID=1349799 RepID=UPI001E46D3D7|nr:flagellar hook assembly protein FlgD [Rhizobium sp. C1]MCD2179039.1 flagellar hook assembly protein FlgD [Rhizobium sp. C1]